jgi:hypothetical protein
MNGIEMVDESAHESNHNDSSVIHGKTRIKYKRNIASALLQH